MPRFFSRWRIGAAWRAPHGRRLRARAFARGRPLGRGTRTAASVASASVTSAGEALSSQTAARKTLTVDQYHPLRALAPLGFTHREAPFLAGAKLPSQEGLVHFSRPSSSRAPQQGTPCLQPDAFLFPLLQPPPAGRGRRKLLGQGTAKRHRFAESTECLPNRPGSTPTVGPGCPADALVREVMAQSAPTARPSTASAFFSS